jgi:hypothetical protein
MMSTSVSFQTMMNSPSSQIPLKLANELVPTTNCVPSHYKTFEDLPVGVMAEMWKYQKKVL